MKSIKEVKSKYLELLYYSLEKDYESWEVEETSTYIKYISPRYGNILFVYMPWCGIFVKEGFSNSDTLFKFRTINPFCKRRILLRKMVNFTDNKEELQRKISTIKKHEKLIDNAVNKLNDNPTYQQYKRASKLKRITEEE